MIDYGCGGVTLASITAIPLNQLRRWRNNYRIRKWTRQNDLLATFDQDAWKERLAKDPSIKMYSIFNLNDEGIGVCGLTNIRLVDRNAEFSLYIAPEFQRKGYGKNALKTLISHGFNAYGFQVIWGETFQHNPAAEMFVNLGLSKEGERRSFYFRDGRHINASLYSILREEWLSNEQFDGFRDEKCST